MEACSKKVAPKLIVPTNTTYELDHHDSTHAVVSSLLQTSYAYSNTKAENSKDIIMEYHNKELSIRGTLPQELKNEGVFQLLFSSDIFKAKAVENSKTNFVENESKELLSGVHYLMN